MLNEKDKGYLIQIINYCNRIETLTNTITKEDFDNTLDYKEIICFNLLQIGELSKNLSNEFINEYNQIPWKYIKGMRDKIAHGYGTIDYEIVFNTAMIDVTNLNKYCKKIIM